LLYYKNKDKKMKQKSEKELHENYNKFISILNKYFTGDRLEKLLFMYSAEELGTNMAIAPASGNVGYHNCYIGGYIDHIFNVCKNSLRVKDMFVSMGGQVDFTDEELIFCALHHDLGKLGTKGNPYYTPNASEWHVKNQGKVFVANPNLSHMTHTDRTMFLLQHYNIKITEAEYFGMKLTDGLYDEDNVKYLKVFDTSKRMKYKIPYIMHWADHMSTVIESQENEL
jgi:hypothetical protein